MMSPNPYREISNLTKKPLTAAQESLQKAFLSLAETKPYEEISVTELSKKAHVARTTFYSLYPNTDALLEEIENAIVYDLLQIGPPEKDQTDYLRKCAAFVDENRHTLIILLRRHPSRRLIDKWKMVVKYHFYEDMEKKSSEKSELALELMAVMSLGACVWRLQYPDRYDVEGILQMVSASMQAL